MQPLHFKRLRLIHVKKLLSISFFPKGRAKKWSRLIRTFLSFYDLLTQGLVLPLIQFPFALNLLEDISTDNRVSFHNQSDEDSFCWKHVVHTFYANDNFVFQCTLPSHCLCCNRCSAYFLFANRNLVLHPLLLPSHYCPYCIRLQTFYLKIGILFCTRSPPIAPIALALSSSVISISAIAPLFPATPHYTYSPSSWVLQHNVT